MARIMAWADLFWPAIGGVEVVTQRMLRDLHQMGHEVEIMAGWVAPLAKDEPYYGMPVHRMVTMQVAEGRDPLALAHERQRVRTLVERFQPELMILMQPIYLLFYYQAARMVVNPPTLYWMQGHYDEFWGPHMMTGQALRKAAYVIACSEELLQTGHTLAPEIIGKSGVVWNTLPMPDLAPAPLPWDPPTLMYVGRLSPEKGVDTLIRAFARAADRLPQARLALTGDGVQRAELEALVRSLGMETRIEFRGWAKPDDVPRVINSVTAIALPSLTEGLPLVAVQTAQMGRPLLGTTAGGIPEICVDGETGLLCEPEDVDGLAANILRLLSEPETARAMGAAARRRSENEFAWERLPQAADAIIRRLLVPISAAF